MQKGHKYARVLSNKNVQIRLWDSDTTDLNRFARSTDPPPRLPKSTPMDQRLDDQLTVAGKTAFGRNLNITSMVLDDG